MKKHIKILVDLGMTVLLLLLMVYERIGAAAHEWLGIVLFLLVVLHHVLNRKWSKNLLKGIYRPMRISQTTVVALVLCAMLGSMVSGIVMSRHALALLFCSCLSGNGLPRPTPINRFANPKQIDWRNHGGIHTKESVRLRRRNLPGAQLR